MHLISNRDLHQIFWGSVVSVVAWTAIALVFKHPALCIISPVFFLVALGAYIAARGKR